MTCPVCHGARETGWLCEDHPALPWEHDNSGGAGEPCVCNPEGAVRWSEILAKVTSEKPPS